MPFVQKTLLFATAASALLRAQAATYHLQDTYVGGSFLSGFQWETFTDPSGGYVNFLSQADALNNNLTYAQGSTFVIRADDQKVVAGGARGRDSVRITSHNRYSTSAIVLDLAHMPGGCGQWPAFWTADMSQAWPNGGEIDIIEGVNSMTSSQAGLHTTSGCSMPAGRQMKGSDNGKNDCDTRASNNAGCQALFTDNTFGQNLNQQGGGYFVVTRNNQDGISMYFWPRWDSSVPTEVVTGGPSLTPSDSWGEPQGYFPTTQCDFGSHFSSHNIVIDLSFCGPWAGTFFQSMGCGSQSCNDYVANNPGAFSDAYFEINALRVYTA